jgi:acetyltransferase-like isoleucine patch superfamily enzyme
MAKKIMKALVKAFLHLLVIISTYYYLTLSRFIGFELVAFKISMLAYRRGNQIRYNFYKKTLQAVGENVLFSFGTIVTNKNTTIGSNVRFGPFNTIGWAKIGDDILTAQYVHILSGSEQHSFSRLDMSITAQPGKIRCVNIDGNNWIGANVVVMDDIGKGSVIGSSSVVVSKIIANVVAVGNPCRVLKARQ